jgi:hypothetical protein
MRNALRNAAAVKLLLSAARTELPTSRVTCSSFMEPFASGHCGENQRELTSVQPATITNDEVPMNCEGQDRQVSNLVRTVWKITDAEAGYEPTGTTSAFSEHEYGSAARSLREGTAEMFTKFCRNLGREKVLRAGSKRRSPSAFTRYPSVQMVTKVGLRHKLNQRFNRSTQTGKR